MFFVILVDDVYCVAIHDLSPVLTALFSIELGGFNKQVIFLGFSFNLPNMDERFYWLLQLLEL